LIAADSLSACLTGIVFLVLGYLLSVNISFGYWCHRVTFIPAGVGGLRMDLSSK